MSGAIDDIDVISIVEAARRLGIHKNSAYKAAVKGSLPSVRIGGRVLVPLQALNDMLIGQIGQPPKTPLPLRRFSEDDDRIIIADYAHHVPVQDIADKLHRTCGSIRQRVLHLGLHRSGQVSQLLRWAPEELRADFNDNEPEKWVAACYAWRDQQQQQSEQANDEAAQHARDKRLRLVAEINAKTDLTRNDKMRAKRMLGLTLEEIAVEYRITRERVRQITSPNYQPPDGHQSRLPVEQRLTRLEERHAQQRQRVIKDAVIRVFAAWQALPPEAKAEFAIMIQETHSGDRETDDGEDGVVSPWEEKTW